MEKSKEILRISKNLGLSHIGSCLSVLPILEDIYAKKQKVDKVILDGAHSHLAHLMFLQGNPERLLRKYGIHCDRKAGCDALGGSLGHGLGISIGYALAGYIVHCIVTDGSMMEGSNWEALRLIHDLQLNQISIYCNFNGYTAVDSYDSDLLEHRMRTFVKNIKVYHTSNGEGFDGVQGHYKVIT